MSPTTTFNTCVVVNLDSINFKNSVEDNMRNLTLIIGLMGGCAYANAAPNIWSSSFNHGFDEYILTNSQNQKLTVMCNSAAADIFDHSVIVKTKGKEFQNTDSSRNMEFLFDGEYTATTSGTTAWRSASNDWDEFRSRISKAKKIEVFYNNKKIATFLPTVTSVKRVAHLIGECLPMSYRDM